MEIVSTEEVDDENESNGGTKADDWVPSPNKGEIKLTDSVGKIVLSDDKNKRILVEKIGFLGYVIIY